MTKDPKKVRGFVWEVALDKVNTLDNLQVRHPNQALSPSPCVMCLTEPKTGSHLFLHCGVARYMWHNLFGFKGQSLVMPTAVVEFLHLRFVRRCKKRFGIRLWAIWVERNEHIFHNRSHDAIVWDRLFFQLFYGL